MISKTISIKMAAILACSLPAMLLWEPARSDDELSRPDEHAPISVMGDHFHEKGEFMFSYRYMDMQMAGNLLGSRSISPDEIVTSVPNRFANPPMMPPTLRVVPVDMRMQMQMLGIMYAPTDRVTLMGMVNQIEKTMDLVTYMGPAGTTQLGSFRSSTSGLGDTSVAALIRLHDAGGSRVHVTAGVSIPTGSTDETGTILTPMGTTPSPRLPYPMQLGSGTYDLLGGLTWSRLHDNWSWGSQWRSTLRTGDNDEGYTLGDEHRLTAWYARMATSRLSWSARVEYLDRGNISGIDPLIALPVQTADPDRQGGSRLDVALGINLTFTGGHRLALEAVSAVDQDLDGPQMETDTTLTLGYQLSF